ncbi:hypothetical protein QTP88_000043 [Uroleucon formosanum]
MQHSILNINELYSDHTAVLLSLSTTTPTNVKPSQSAIFDSSSNPNKSTKPKNILKILNEMLAQKRRARARWQSTRNPLDKHALNSISNRLNKEFYKINSERYENNITKLQSINGFLWRKTKNILKLKELIPPIKLPNNKIAILYLIYTADIPTTSCTILNTFADDTYILATDSDPTITSFKLQHHLNLLENWFTPNLIYKILIFPLWYYGIQIWEETTEYWPSQCLLEKNPFNLYSQHRRNVTDCVIADQRTSHTFM